MKILSVIVPIDMSDAVRAQFDQEKGVDIFREKEISKPIHGFGRIITHTIFLLYVMDPEAETLLALKYPYTFEDVSA